MVDVFEVFLLGDATVPASVKQIRLFVRFTLYALRTEKIPRKSAIVITIHNKSQKRYSKFLSSYP